MFDGGVKIKNEKLWMSLLSCTQKGGFILRAECRDVLSQA